MTDQTEIRVIQLRETVDLGDGMAMEGYEHAIQYRNDDGPWVTVTVPVTQTYNRNTYQRMKDGADG
jgi:hypothetical protein